MLSRARVIQNNTFLTHGYIWVRPDVTTNIGGNPDLSEDPKRYVSDELKDFFEDEPNYCKAGCHKAYVYSPFGGGNGYGMFTVPQINSRGVVAEIDCDPLSFVWLGAIFEKTQGEINLPQDDGINDPHVTQNNRKIKDLDTALVISMKHTKLKDPLKAEDSRDTLDWKMRPTENLLVMTRDGIQIQHNILNDDDESQGTLLLEMDADGISMDYNNNKLLGRLMIAAEGGSKKPMIEISAIDATNENATKVTQITGTSSKLDIVISEGDKQNTHGIFISNEGESKGINIQSIAGIIAMTNDAIAIKGSADKKIDISIEPGPNGKVSLGDGNGYVVTTKGPPQLGIMGVDELMISANVYA